MSTLTIHHWHNSYFARQRLQPEQLQQWDASLYTLDLSRDIDTLLAPGELVYIRQLKLKTRLGEDRPATEAGEVWRAALLRELVDALDDDQSADVVRYPARRDALADMLYRSCCGDSSRRWVWLQMGLISSHDHGSAVYLQRVLAVLQQEETLIWPLLCRLLLAEAGTGAFSVLLQRAEPQQLQILLAACPQTRPWQALLFEGAPAATMQAQLPDTPLLQALLQWLARPRPAARRQQAPLQVVLATLIHSATALSATPGSGRAALQVLAAAGARLQQSLQNAAPRPVGTMARDMDTATPDLQRTQASDTRPTPQPDVQAHRAPAEPTPEQPDDEELPPPPALPTARERLPTEWGGLLFLLALIPGTHCLDRLQQLDEELDLPADALPRLLRQVGQVQLGVPASDAALRAFCGGWQPHASWLDEHGRLLLPEPLALLAGQTGAELQQLLLQRLPDGEPDLVTLCRRPGMLQLEAGWIELHLPLQSADTRLRRAALDLDPGWLAWLGCVVRFTYE